MRFPAATAATAVTVSTTPSPLDCWTVRSHHHTAAAASMFWYKALETLEVTCKQNFCSVTLNRTWRWRFYWQAKGATTGLYSYTVFNLAFCMFYGTKTFDTFLLDAVLLEWQENLVNTKHIIPTLLAEVSLLLLDGLFLTCTPHLWCPSRIYIGAVFVVYTQLCCNWVTYYNSSCITTLKTHSSISCHVCGDYSIVRVRE